MIIVSAPSVVKSEDSVLVNDPTPPAVMKEPLFAESVKSAPVVVPLFVQ
jgi:hypothetical protein